MNLTHFFFKFLCFSKQKLKPDVFILPMARRCLGVTAIRPSPDHMQLAVGMKSGRPVVL